MHLLRSLWILAATVALAGLAFGALHKGAGMPPGLAAIAAGVAAWEFGRSVLKRVL